MENKKNSDKSITGLVASMLIFGTVGVLRRYIPLPSAVLAFARGILGGLFLFLYAAVSPKGRGEKLPPGVFGRAVLTGAFIGINWMLLFEAYNHTSVAVATLCYYMQPTLVILLSPFFFNEKLTPVKGICAAVSVFGMALVSGVFGTSQTADTKGVLLGLGAACFYAAVVIMNKKTGAADPYRKTAVMLLSAGAVMIPYILLAGEVPEIQAVSGAVVPVLIMGIVHTGFAYALYFGSMSGLRMQTVAVLSYIDPVSALFFSALLLGEPLTLLNMAGAVLIIGAALISETAGN